ncbi:hypothetical protein [Natronospira bacteriovora]|uniref:Outer membrane beta-barrel porin/alpha-amylase n=1 Tax=Natronospira bacteriovora TaxID=3069753 RepID=A0ABU0WA43_9GAMM|nr:hypothetical protein [Natronospira sp. AB-CW4]MDQ2070866.1 hypothetical protein [Natronospira sp. AB-CW4]
MYVHSKHVFGMVFFLCAFLLSPTGMAGDWVAESEFRASDADSRSFLISLDRTIGERGLAFVSLGETWINGSEQDMDTRRQSVGGMLRLDDEWRLTGYYERWGRRGDIISDRVAFILARDFDQWGFSANAGARWITLEAGAPARRDRNGAEGPPINIPVNPGDPDDGEVIAEDYDTRAINLGLRLRYRPSEEWTFAAGFTHYDYDRDPTQLAARDQVERYSASAVTLAQGFLDRSVYLDARYDLGNYRDLSVYVSRDRSAVDGRDADSIILSYLQPLSAAWDLRLEVGRTQTDGFDASHSVGIGVTWYP